MLSIFPDLLIFSLLATTVIRVTVGFVLVYFGITILYSKKTFLVNKLKLKSYPLPEMMSSIIAGLGLLAGSFLIIGFLTQITAIISAYLFSNLWFIDRNNEKTFGQNWLFYLVMIILSMSLLISGAGVLAIDLPI